MKQITILRNPKQIWKHAQFQTLFKTENKFESLKKIIEKKGLAALFDFIGGSDINEKGRVTKEDVIKYVLEMQNLSGKEDECVLIGDRKFDVTGAHATGLKCAGILWGFGNRQELEEYGADWIFETPAEVEKFLLSGI